MGDVEHAKVAGLLERHQGGVIHVVGVVGIVVVVDGVERTDESAVTVEEGVGAVESILDRLVVVSTVDSLEISTSGENVDKRSETCSLILGCAVGVGHRP